MEDSRKGLVKNNIFRVFAIISMIFTTLNAEAKLTLREIRSASKDVLVVFFTSDTLNLTEVDISNPSEWKINDQPCRSIRKSSITIFRDTC